MTELERQATIEQIRRLREERIRYFIPHGGQEDFIRVLSQPGAFIVISGAGSGWGKTDLIIALTAAVMWPSLAPKCFASVVETCQTFPHRARIYSTPAELEEIGSLQTAILRLFPKGRYTVNKGRYSYPSIFKSQDTGWVLDLFSYERDESEAAGPNIGLQAFNEPPPEPLWKEAVARSRAGGIIVGGMTSLLQNPWVVDGVLNKSNGKEIRVRYGDACENCIQHGKNGHLQHEQIERILAQYDPDEREARKTGKPLSLSGRILKSFDRNVHVSKEPIVPPADGVAHWQVIDPAIGKPMFVLWSFVDATGSISIYREYPDFDFFGAKDSNLTVKDYSKLFLALENGTPMQGRIMDRHFGNVQRTNGGLTLIQEFAEAGLEFQDSYRLAEVGAEVETGILKIKEYLRYDSTKPIDGLNRPKMIISPTCTNTIAAAERWSRNPQTGKPLDLFKDPMDCIRYLCMAEPKIEHGLDWGGRRQPAYGVGNG